MAKTVRSLETTNILMIFISSFREYAKTVTKFFLHQCYLPILIVFMTRHHSFYDGFEFIFLSCIVGTAAIFLLMKQEIHQNLVNSVICMNSSFLIYLTMTYEKKNYWLMHLVLLFFMNTFILSRLCKKFSLPEIDLLTVSLSFVNIFLINAFF